MNKHQWFALVCGIIVVLSCTKENSKCTVYQKQQHCSMETETITLCEAVEALNNAMRNTTNTKSDLNRSYSMEDVIVVGRNSLSLDTKSTSYVIPDTLIYLVNFDDELGFAIMAGNRRLGEDVYCITESGSLSLDDCVEAFAFISEHSYSDCNITDEETVLELGPKIVPSIILSSMMLDLMNGKNEDVPKTKVFINSYGPYIHTKWSQESGIWNKYTPNHYPAGCVAIATAQIMQYNRKPANPVFDGKQCNWNDMDYVCNYMYTYCVDDFYGTSEQQDQVGHFVYEIGKKHNCYIRYGEDGSGGWADGAKRTLKNYGYSNVKKILGFGKTNQKKADAQLKSGLPVYLDGSGNGSGHA